MSISENDPIYSQYHRQWIANGKESLRKIENIPHIQYATIKIRTSCLLFIALVGSGCGSAGISSTMATGISPASLISSRSLTPSETQLSTTTELPSVTNTPFFNLPYLLGTPMPKPLVPITADRASDVTQLARWGKGEMYNVAWSPDNSLLAISTTMGIRLYDSKTFTEIRSFSDFNGLGIFSPNGTILLATKPGGNSILLLRISDGMVVGTLNENPDSITCMTLSADGTLLAIGSNNGTEGTIRLWRVIDGEQLLVLSDIADVYALTISRDGKLLTAGTSWTTLNAAARYDEISTWRISDGKLINYLRDRSSENDYIYTMLFSPDGRILAQVMGSGIIRLFQVSDRRLLHTLRGDSYPVFDMSFSADGAFLASGSNNGTIRLWWVPSGMLLRTLEGHSGQILSLAFSPDGMSLASVAGDNSMRLWNVSDGKNSQSLAYDSISTEQLAFSPDGAILAVGSNPVIFRRVSDGSVIRTLQAPAEIKFLSFSPDLSLLAGISDDDTIQLWQVSDGTLLRVLGNHYSESLAFSPDGTLLASGSNDGTIFIWRDSDGTLISTFKADTLAFNHVVFSPDGTLLASWSRKGGIQVWRIADGILLNTVNQSADKIAFSPDGNLMAGVYYGGAFLWNFSDGRYQTLQGAHVEGDIAFSPDGTLLSIGAWDTTICLWRIPDGTQLQPLKGISGDVFSLAFSPDGLLLASGLEDGTIRLWGILP